MLRYIEVAAARGINNKRSMNWRLLGAGTLGILITTAGVRADDLVAIKGEITKRHDEAVKRLQDWIAQVSIAAEDRGYPEGAEYMAKLARDAGFQQATHQNGRRRRPKRESWTNLR